MRADDSWRPRRPRQVIMAAVVALVAVVLIALALYAPVLGLVATVDASTAGLLDVPVLAIALGGLLTLVVIALGLLLAVTRRRPAAAWAWAALTVLLALIGSLVPVVATAAASVDQLGQVGPFIDELVSRFL